MSLRGLGRKNGLMDVRPDHQDSGVFQLTIAASLGRNRECHFTGPLWKCFGEEVGRSRAGLHRSERMPDCLSTLAYGF